MRRNAKYTFTTTTTDFITSIACWVEEELLQSLKGISILTVMGDECTDVTSMEELSLCFRWLRDGKPEECHENTIRSVKRSYTAIVVTFEAIYEESDDADTRGLSLLLKILETAAFIYMLSEVLAALQGFAKPCRQRVLISFNLLHWCLRLFRNCSVFKLLLWILHGSLKKCISDFTSSGIPLESFD